ncbi:MAG: hypothetical protein Q9M30_10695 [Mariprofundaceae bacterium]|nr:hypothetical protein [Mariprofundaceae bacterium]
MPRSIAVYISGHGYGHLSQIAPVLNRFAVLCPDVHLLLRTALPQPLLASRIRTPFTILHDWPVDIGVVQKSAISEDIPATILAAQRFYADFPERVEREIELFSTHRPLAVLSDVSPLAFPVARRLGIPSIAIASLDWHDIYRDFLAPDDSVLATLEQAHATCDLLIQPPLSMPMQSFPNHSKVELIVDDEHPLPDTNRAAQPTALIMFGGAGDPPFDINALGKMTGWQFLTLNPVPNDAPANVRQAAVGSGGTAALMTECDIVITKPGYGTLAECWLTNTPIAYLPRESFAEYPYLDDWLQSSAPAARMAVQDFINGNWLPAMQLAMDCPRSYPPIPASGAAQAAELIAQELPSPRNTT